MQLRGHAVWLYDMARIWAARTGEQVVLVSANDHVHTRNSAHYADRAIDLQGTGLDGLAAWYRAFHLTVYWRVPGHWQHVHVEVAEGCSWDAGSC